MQLFPDNFEDAVRVGAHEPLRELMRAEVKAIVPGDIPGIIKVWIPGLPGGATDDEGLPLRDTDPRAWSTAKPETSDAAARPVRKGDHVAVYFAGGDPENLRYRGKDWSTTPDNPPSPTLANIFEDVAANGTPFAILFDRASGTLTLQGGPNSIQISSAGITIIGDIITTGTINGPTIVRIDTTHAEHTQVVNPLTFVAEAPGGGS